VPAILEKAPSSAEPATPAPVPTNLLRQNTKLLAMLRDAVKATQDEAGWAWWVSWARISATSCRLMRATMAMPR
jgi:hypothetical protein